MVALDSSSADKESVDQPNVSEPGSRPPELDQGDPTRSAPDIHALTGDTLPYSLAELAEVRTAAASRASPLRGLMPIARRLGWGVADQAVSSVTNFAVSLYVARSLGATQFGAFGLAYVTYGFALNASRGLATDPLMVRFSGTDITTWRRGVASCVGTAASVGLAVGACVLGAALILSGSTRAAFLALGLTLPGLLLQDSWRYSFFALGRGQHAFLNDMVWAVFLVPAVFIIRAEHRLTVFWLILAWGAAGSVAAAFGPIQARVVPRLSGTWGWLTQHRDLGPRYLAEGVSGSAAGQARAYGVGLILGLAAVGYVQASVTLIGPMTILFAGMSLVLIPEAARVVRRSPRHLQRFCLVLCVLLSAAGLLWGLFLLVALPRGVGAWVLGGIWRPTYPLVLPTMIGLIGTGAGFAAGAGLHALGASRRSLRVALIAAGSNAAFSVAGAALWGPVGTIWGTAVAVWIAAAGWWWQLRAAQHEPGLSNAGQPSRTTAGIETTIGPVLVYRGRHRRQPAAAGRVQRSAGPAGGRDW